VSTRPFAQVDVFTHVAYLGNPVAVILDAEDLDDGELARIARWTNLSETTFVLTPDDPAADYRVRIFTPTAELPFAGHPTLGTCHAWLAAGGLPRHPDRIVQQCAAGLIEVRRGLDDHDRPTLAFAAPPLIRSGPVDDHDLDRIATELRIARSAIVDAAWIDNGPGWVGILLASADDVLALRPGTVTGDIGVIGPHSAESEYSWELRAFFPVQGATVEDPVTGSLNASAADWLHRSGRTAFPYVARQGTALGRAGRITLSEGPDGDGRVRTWVAGGTITCIEGTISA
jgi:PhzF family phenazine biosynthesis protein